MDEPSINSVDSFLKRMAVLFDDAANGKVEIDLHKQLNDTAKRIVDMIRADTELQLARYRMGETYREIDFMKESTPLIGSQVMSIPNEQTKLPIEPKGKRQ
jgi:hypothetical protein